MKVAQPTTESQSVIDLLNSTFPVNSGATSDEELVRSWRDRYENAALFPAAITELEAISDHEFRHDRTVSHFRIYRPSVGRLPAIIYFYGGGFVAGSVAAYDVPLRRLAKEFGWAVVAVDYRLAPEFPYPAAIDDCYATVLHVLAHAETLNLDKTKIVVAGDSAGGLLAACTALIARDRGLPNLAGMVCIYPMTDLRGDAEYLSRVEHDGRVVRMDELRRAIGLYLSGVDTRDPDVSPVLAEDLSRLPPSLVITCDCDPLADEGALFAERLSDAGVDTTHVSLEGAIHGLIPLMSFAPEGALRLFRPIKSFLQRL